MLKMLKIKWLRSEKEIKYKIIRSQSYLLISFEESVYKNPDKICQDFFLEIVRIFLEK